MKFAVSGGTLITIHDRILVNRQRNFDSRIKPTISQA